MGKEIHYSGPICFASGFCINRIAVSREHQEKVSSNKGPKLLQLGIDCYGRIYGDISALEDLLKGKFRK